MLDKVSVVLRKEYIRMLYLIMLAKYNFDVPAGPFTVFYGLIDAIPNA